MKTMAYIIGSASFVLAVFILETLFNTNYINTIISAVAFAFLAGAILNHRPITKPFEDHDVKNIKEILKSYKLNQIPYDSRRLFELMLMISIGKYRTALKEYHQFTYDNDIDQYKQSYIYQYLFLMRNDIDDFLQLKRAYNITKNKVREDNIKVMMKPGLVHLNREKYLFNLELLDDIYALYMGNMDFDALDRKKYIHQVYNYMKEKALYHYLNNTEQPKRRHAFWLDSDYIFDEFIHIEQPEEEDNE